MIIDLVFSAMIKFLLSEKLYTKTTVLLRVYKIKPTTKTISICNSDFTESY